MASIGQTLRDAREKKGVSIPDVSHATRIKIEYLERMESDQFDKLIAPTYAKSFLRMYAEYLGLNAAPMLDQLGKWQPAKSVPSAPAAPPTPRKPAMPSGARTTPRPESPRPQPPTKRRVTEQASPTTSAPSAPPPKPQQDRKLQLQQEKPKPPPLPALPETVETTRGFPLKATLALVVVITVALTAIVLLAKRRNEPSAETDLTEIKAQETLRAKPQRAADVLPVPPAP